MIKNSNWHFVTTVDNIKPNEALSANVKNVQIALCGINDAVYAFSNICTHEYACMSDGFIDGELIECPLHQAQFHIPTGKVMSPPAEVDLETFQVKVVKNEIFVQIPK